MPRPPHSHASRLRLIAVLAGAAALAACSSGEEREPAPVSFQGTQPSGASARPSAPSAPLTNAGPDARGVVFNDGYETIIARDGDTVDSLAARVGVTGAELAAYNGLPTTYRPQGGDELVLPAKPGGYRGASTVAAAPSPVASPTQEPTAVVPAPAPIPATPIGAQAAAPAAAPSAAPPAADGSTWSASSIAAAIGTGEAGQAATPPAPATEPVAPAPRPTAQAAAAAPAPVAPAPAATPTQPVSVTPAVPAPAAATTTTAATNTRFARPVDAPISRKFSKLPGPNRNDGVDFASPAGMEVRAADAGTVALVSKSLGGLGTIVLIRHDGGLLTVYGRVDNVNVTKGDTVARGQTFANVAALPSPKEPSLHFEVRRGAESVDPAGYI